MEIEKFIKKYNGKSVRDDIMYMSDEAKKFVSDFRNMLKTELGKTGNYSVNIKPNHYDLSGFVSNGEKYVYITYSIPRGGVPIRLTEQTGIHGFLVRTAESDKDYRGGRNNFAGINQLIPVIKLLLA